MALPVAIIRSACHWVGFWDPIIVEGKPFMSISQIERSFYLHLLTHVLLGGKRVSAKEEIQSIHWATWTGVLGSEVNGIWPKYTQVNDINATDASFDHQTIVTGDDFGLVKLFRFPCVKKGPFI